MQLQQKDNIPFLAIRVADLLQGVKGRDGEFYVKEDGTLNYLNPTSTSTNIKFSIRAATDNLIKNVKKDSKLKGIVEVIEKEQDSNYISITQYTMRSPGYIAEAIPKFKGFFKLATKAMHKQEKLRSEFKRGLNRVYGMLKNKEEKEALQKLLWNGDTVGKEYTASELVAPSRVRGLKHNAPSPKKKLKRRTFTGAWIETLTFWF